MRLWARHALILHEYHAMIFVWIERRFRHIGIVPFSSEVASHSLKSFAGKGQRGVGATKAKAIGHRSFNFNIVNAIQNNGQAGSCRV